MNMCAVYFVKLYKTSRAMGNTKRELVMVVRRCVEFVPEEKSTADEVTLRLIK